MKEIMVQYGQSVIAAVIAILLLVLIGGSVSDKRSGIYTATGRTIGEASLTTGGNAEFERYWRIR